MKLKFKPGTFLKVLELVGYTLAGGKGDAVLRCDTVTPLRSSPV